jgi:hypothetical protein
MKDAIREIVEWNKGLEASSTTFLPLERFELDAGLKTVTGTRRRRVHIA